MGKTFETRTTELRNKIIDDGLQLCITNGNRKLGKLPGLSFAPLLTCDGMKLQCWNQGCYSKWYFRFSPNPWFNIMQNTLLVHEDEEQFWLELGTWLLHNSPEYFRWFIVGDIPNIPNFVERMISIAHAFPRTSFMGYTKKHDRLQRLAFPDNLIMHNSYWIGEEGKAAIDSYPHVTIVSRDPATTISIMTTINPCAIYLRCNNDCAKCNHRCWYLDKYSPKTVVVFEKHGSGQYKRKKRKVE